MSRNPLVEHRWVRIMCDFAASGVWSKDGGACSPDHLPVSQPLRDRILAWQDLYEQLYAIPERPMTSADRETERGFNAEGLAIALAVKQELPDWTVIHYDEAAAALAAISPRAFREYEIFPTAEETESRRLTRAAAEAGLIPGVTRVRQGETVGLFLAPVAIRDGHLLIEFRSTDQADGRGLILDRWSLDPTSAEGQP